jgi:putative acetyltransferase
MPNSATIRHAESADDIDVVKDLFLEYAAEIGVDLCFQGFAEELASLPGEYAPPAGTLLLALAGESVVGCVGLRDLSRDICEMKRFFVRRKFRGSGVGRRLARAAIREAAAMGYAAIYLDTLADMQAARRLYQSLGFKQIAPYYENPIPGTIYLALEMIVA